MIKLIHGDAIEVLNKLINDGIKIDAIITDPPYNVGYKYNKYKDNLADSDYIHLFKQFNEIRLKNDIKISMMQYPTEAIRVFTQAFGFPDAVTTWIYNSNTPKQSRLIFNYGEFYRINVRQPYKNPNDKRIKARIAAGKVDAKAYDFWHVNQVKNVSKVKEGNIHSCPIPLPVAINMVLLTTNKGDTVFDPFTGSGTIALACKMTGRNFYGSEMDEDYLEIALNRINEGGKDAK